MKQLKRPAGYDPVDWALKFCWRSPSDCWIYMRSTDSCGYVQVNGVVAHRLVYEKHVGPIAAGLELDHLCGNRNCLNPGHLEPVTRAENIRRSNAAQATHDRWRSQDTCARGHVDDWRWVKSNDRTSGVKRVCAECSRQSNARHDKKRGRKTHEFAA